MNIEKPELTDSQDSLNDFSPNIYSDCTTVTAFQNTKSSDYKCNVNKLNLLRDTRPAYSGWGTHAHLHGE